MKRQKITLQQIAAPDNLHLALHEAAKGKKQRSEVQPWLFGNEDRLQQLNQAIVQERLPYGHYREFHIFDPKKRLIHAACFADRVFHHALMNIAGQTFERGLSPMSYACRPGMGVHRAIRQVQKNMHRFQWYCQIDIDGYFAAIDHAVLLKVLQQRFKGREIYAQFERIVQTYEVTAGRGLPIGALTSQYFANYYLDVLDRFLAASDLVRAHIRYMDDIVWWSDTKQEAMQVLQEVRGLLAEQRRLQIKPAFRVQRCEQGVLFCGFRVLPGVLRLSKRRKRRYQQRRHYWERQYQQGLLSAEQLQTAYASVLAITTGTDSLQWRQHNLQCYPAIVV